MFTYLFINLGSVIIPFIFSFHHKVKFYNSYSSFFLACIIVGFVFLTWDVIFTEIGIWGFNPEYLMGIYFLGLPLEEYLFFICIPYSCFFIFHVFEYNFNFKKNNKRIKLIGYLLSFLLLLIGVFSYDKYYTFVTFISLSVMLQVAYFYINMNLFYLGFSILQIPFFIINGLLTGSFIKDEVVWYNNAHNLGIRLGTIPLEDMFYGMLLLLLIMIIKERLKLSMPINNLMS